MENTQKVKDTDSIARIIGLDPDTMSDEKRAFIDEHFKICRPGAVKNE